MGFPSPERRCGEIQGGVAEVAAAVGARADSQSWFPPLNDASSRPLQPHISEATSIQHQDANITAYYAKFMPRNRKSSKN